MWLVSATDPDGATYEYKYDAMGNVVQVTNPRGELFLQEYDSSGRKIAIKTFEGAKFAYGHKGPVLMRLDTRPGAATCPEGALDRGSGFGTAQATVDAAGDAYGCHSCGSMDSGWDTPGENGHQHWTCDHVPPRTTYRPDGDNRDRSRDSGAVRLYPHCRSCAARQGGLMSHMSPADRASRGDAVMTSHGH